jgi:hypothetical protein
MLMLDATTSRRTGWSISASSRDPGADRVDRAVVGDLVHALADPDPGSEVDDGVDSFESLLDGGRVADLVPAAEKMAGEVGADETGAARDENSFRQERWPSAIEAMT